MGTKSALEMNLCQQMIAAKLPSWKTEFKFHSTRRWRFDFAWPEIMLAVEVEGGIFVKGRHTSPMGFLADCEKYNTAVCMGWSLLRFAAPVINDGSCLETIGICMKMASRRIACEIYCDKIKKFKEICGET